MKVTINTKAQVQVLYVGHEHTPVIYIDDFLLNPHLLKKNAVETAHFFNEPKSSYPGIRAIFPQEVTDIISPLIAQPIREVFNIPNQYQAFVARSDYSLVTSPPATLRPAQKIPHADSSRIGDFAILLYINEGNFGGTSFYRHRTTGVELLMTHHEKKYWESVNGFINDYESKDIGFINGSDNHYERIGNIPYKPNRLVIYPTALLHSGNLTSDSIDDNPATGRLTANIMMVFA